MSENVRGSTCGHTHQLSSDSRRHVLVAAVGLTSVVGAGLAAWPFAASWQPSARAKGLGGPVTVNTGALEPGQLVTVIWRGQPVWVVRRTQVMLERMTHPHWQDGLRDPDSLVASQQPDYTRNATRSLRPEFLVTIALCTHLGCVPGFRPDAGGAGLGSDWMGGFVCPCHGSRFDLAGRVVKNVPAPTNLVIPPHRYINDRMLEIGVHHAIS